MDGAWYLYFDSWSCLPLCLWVPFTMTRQDQGSALGSARPHAVMVILTIPILIPDLLSNLRIMEHREYPPKRSGISYLQDDPRALLVTDPRSCCRGAIVVRDGIFRTLTTNDWPSVCRTRDQHPGKTATAFCGVTLDLSRKISVEREFLKYLTYPI